MQPAGDDIQCFALIMMGRAGACSRRKEYCKLTATIKLYFISCRRDRARPCPNLLYIKCGQPQGLSLRAHIKFSRPERKISVRGVLSNVLICYKSKYAVIRHIHNNLCHFGSVGIACGVKFTVAADNIIFCSPCNCRSCPIAYIFAVGII